MKRSDFRFIHRLRVRWAEVDMQKIVFNAHYLMYFDTAVADYWRALAMPYEEAMHSLGGDIYVKKATVEFFASARMDDRLDVGIMCSKIGNSSMVFTGAIFRDNDLLITCELLYVFADPATQKSRPVPQPLRAHYDGSENVATLTPGLQARLLRSAIALAACQPHVRAFFNFELVDEPRLAGWQSGLVWRGVHRKPAAAAFAAAPRTCK